MNQWIWNLRLDLGQHLPRDTQRDTSKRAEIEKVDDDGEPSLCGILRGR
jgi:hypothetical protein